LVSIGLETSALHEVVYIDIKNSLNFKDNGLLLAMTRFLRRRPWIGQAQPVCHLDTKEVRVHQQIRFILLKALPNAHDLHHPIERLDPYESPIVKHNSPSSGERGRSR